MEYLLQSKGLWIHAAGVPETTTTTSVAVGSPVKGKDPKGVIQDKGQEATWLKEDSKAHGIIGLYVSTDLQPIIDGKFSAFEAWWAIHEYFERLSKSNKVVLQVQLYHVCKLVSWRSNFCVSRCDQYVFQFYTFGSQIQK